MFKVRFVTLLNQNSLLAFHLLQLWERTERICVTARVLLDMRTVSGVFVGIQNPHSQPQRHDQYA